MSVWMYVSIFGLKPSEASFSALFRTSTTSVYSDVICGLFVDPTGVKARVKFGDSRTNRFLDIRLPHFVTNDNDNNDHASRGAFCLKTVEMPPATAAGRISGARFKRGSRNLILLSRTVSPTNAQDMTSITASGQLQNVIKYRTKVRKTGATGIERIIWSRFEVRSPVMTQRI